MDEINFVSEEEFVEPDAETYWEKKSLIQEAFISDMFSLIVGTLPELHKEIADSYLQNYYSSVEELAKD